MAALSYNDWTKTPPFNPAGSAWCYFRLEAHDTTVSSSILSDPNFQNQQCGSVADGAGLAAVGSVAEATFAITQQCSPHPLPPVWGGVSLGLNSWASQNFVNGAWSQGGSFFMGGVRDAGGALPVAWQWFRSSRDSTWLRSADAASFWAPGSPVDTMAASSMQFVATNGFGQLASINFNSLPRAPCCMFPARRAPLLSSAPRLSPAFVPDASGAAWGWVVSSATATGVVVANVSAFFTDGDDTDVPAGVFTLAVASAAPSLGAFAAAFSLTPAGALVVAAPLDALVSAAALPGSAAAAFSFTVIATDGGGLVGPPARFNMTVALARSAGSGATNSAPA